VVLDKVTGRLFQPGNVNELASILAFLVENVEYARILGFAGRSHIFQYFTIDAVLDRIDEIYWGILG
jgi:glycosyltransferase involved in cell wall biosynthesis